ncbi:hypothetical protein WJX72_006075 [[Myrmecia] bisecta]|uniref:DUF218 domain-containing protein n=1 Tax=[Myrmecia] bisecta TaxID=41462 RepID=A0AAW1PXE3_9CHLO
MLAVLLIREILRALPLLENGQPGAVTDRTAHHPVPQLRNLIIVACHAVFTGFDYTKPEAEESWHLLDYQRVAGQAHAFVQHIQVGVVEAAQDPSALLLFSGGQTRKAAGPRSEAEGYWLVAEAAGWWGNGAVRDRIFTEEHARDSLENLLFSICRFFELTGHWPQHILVVGYELKQHRYVNLHRAAAKWPAERFHYLGTPAVNQGALEGEAGTIEAFRQDPYGCHGVLLEKKEARDPFAVGPYLAARCPAMAPLLSYCGRSTFPGRLPWSEQ